MREDISLSHGKHGVRTWLRAAFFALFGIGAILALSLYSWSVMSRLYSEAAWAIACDGIRNDRDLREAVQLAFLGALAAYREMADDPAANPAFIQDDAERALDQLLAEGLRKRWRPVVVNRGSWWQDLLRDLGFQTYSTDGVITLWGTAKRLARPVAIVAVEGTNPLETPDLVRDLAASTVPIDFCRDETEGCPTVHEGFLRYAGYARARVEDSGLIADPDALIVVTGHSLGGASAILLAAQLVHEFPVFRGRMVVVTFGAPGVTRDPKHLAAHLEDLKVVNFRHHQDPIPSLTTLIGLDLPGTTINWHCPKCSHFAPPVFPSAHALSAYRETVNTCLGE